MRNLFIGIFIGYNFYRLKLQYDYAQAHPEDPDVIEKRASIDKMKESIKKSWATAKTSAEFNKIVSDNKLDESDPEKG